MSPSKVANIKDWLAYEEDGKLKLLEISDHDSTKDLVEICKACGARVIGYGAFEFEKDARTYYSFF